MAPSQVAWCQSDGLLEGKGGYFNASSEDLDDVDVAWQFWLPTNLSQQPDFGVEVSTAVADAGCQRCFRVQQQIWMLVLRGWQLQQQGINAGATRATAVVANTPRSTDRKRTELVVMLSLQPRCGLIITQKPSMAVWTRRPGRGVQGWTCCWPSWGSGACWAGESRALPAAAFDTMRSRRSRVITATVTGD